jgi:putative phage-type endonuclease
MRTVLLSQNSPEWLAWRSQGLGASDAPIVTGVSPWRKRSGLLKEKRRALQERPTAIREASAGRAAARGKRLEPEAAEWYRGLTGIACAPVCGEHDALPWLRASLDGWNDSLPRVVELKCPGQSSHDIALGGEVPAIYRPQLVHQSIVAGCARVDYVSFDPDRHGTDRFALVCVTVTQDERDALLEALAAFWEEVTRP